MDGLVTKLCPTLKIPWTVACQAPLSMGFSNKNTGVDSHVLLQEIFLTQRSNPVSCIAGRFFNHLGHQGIPYIHC